MATKLASEISYAIESVVGTSPVALHTPLFSGLEAINVAECISSTMVSSIGPFVTQFEADLSRYTRSNHVIAVVNGTSALHLALIAAGVGPDEEVLLQSLTFVATANAVKYCQAIPHFVDIEESSLGIDAHALRVYLNKIVKSESGFPVNRSSGRRISALIVMHTFGFSSNIVELSKVANDFGICLIEDSAESIGSKYDGRHLGTFSGLGVLSFNGNKTITCGGGGAVLVQEENIADRVRHLSSTGRTLHPWKVEHDITAFNYRMPSINAAIGCGQLQKIDEILQRKKLLASRYKAAFESIEGINFFDEPFPGKSESNYWLQTAIFSQSTASTLDEVLHITNAKGIQTRPAWTPLNTLPMYQKCPSMKLATTHSLSKRIINLPSGPELVS